MREESVDSGVNQQENYNEILKEILDRNDQKVLKTLLMDLHPADIAEAISRFSREDKISVFSYLDYEKAAEVLIEMDVPVRYDILEGLDEECLVEIIKTMDSDDATDIIGELDEEVSKRILSAMPWKEFREVETLLLHDEDTAGGIMALEIVAVQQNKTTQEALNVLRQKADEVEDVFNIYIIDQHRVLKGVVSLKDLVLARPSAKLSDIMEKEPITVHSRMDQEEVAILFRKYDLVSAPVVNEKGQLVGRITVDDVLDVVNEEVSEDMTMLAGITDEEIGERSIFKISRVRLPWLLVAFIGEIISASILRKFEASLSEILMAAFFIPLIMAMGGNTGMQSSTIIIRGLALRDIRLKDTWQRLFRELSATILNGIIIVILLIGVTTFWFQNPVFGIFMGVPIFGIVLGFALMVVLINAAFIGTLLPIFFKSIKIDPAVATAPFITTSNDILGLLVYFGIIALTNRILVG